MMASESHLRPQANSAMYYDKRGLCLQQAVDGKNSWQERKNRWPLEGVAIHHLHPFQTVDSDGIRRIETILAVVIDKRHCLYLHFCQRRES